MEHNPWDGRALRDCDAVSAQPRADREGRYCRAGRDADGAHSGERRREGAVAGQAGARHRLLRHRVPAYLDGRRGLQCGRGVPLSASFQREEFRTGRHPRRRPARRGALLGPVAAGVLRQGRRVAARSERRDLRDPADRGHARRRESRQDADRSEGRRRHPDRRRRSRTGARHSAPVRASRNCSSR